MIYMGVDPGTLTISAAVLQKAEGRPPIVLAVEVIRPSEITKDKLRWRTTEMCVQAMYLGSLAQQHSVRHAVVEGQHFFDRKKDPQDIILLAAVAGACICGLTAYVQPGSSAPSVRYAEAGEWSKMDKKTRANRVRELYMKGTVEKKEIEKMTGKLDGREYLDCIDAIGMAYWELIGAPRSGI